MADYPFATGFTGTGSIQNGDTALGMSFTNASGTTVTISTLGRWNRASNTQMHDMKLYSTTAIASLQRTATLDATIGPDNDWHYGAITPYDVANGATVYIIDESNGLDFYQKQIDGPPVVQNILTTDAGIGYTTAKWGGGSIGPPGGTTNSSNVPVNFQYSSPAYPGWTKVGTVYTLDNAFPYALISALRDATPGDTIKLPVAGAATWGAGGTSITISKAITLDGQGTTITLSTGSPTYTNGVINNSGGARITGFIFQCPTSGSMTAIRCSTTAGWRVDNNTYYGTTSGNPGYFMYFDAYGLGDHNTITTYMTTAEYLFGRGPTDSWTTPHSLGTVNNTFWENNTINGPGYTDFNANSRVVMRFNTVNGANSKTDTHGYSTNQGPYIGCRHAEVYHNNWTYGSNHTAMEFRGGRIIAFGNIATAAGATMYWRDYGYDTNLTNWYPLYQTPLNYPLFNQIGTGQLVVINATALVAYQRAVINTLNDGLGGANTDFTLIGASGNNVNSSFFNSNAQFTATGPGTGTGTVLVAPATEPGYVFSNLRNGSVWPTFTGNVNAGAITLYRTQTGNPSATFTGDDIIRSNRDYFAEAGVATNTGLVVGTVIGSAPSAVGITNQGYWAADEGSWNTQDNQVGTPGYQKGQGRLYVSNGTTWDLFYEPYTYPHPLQGTFPTQVSATVNAAGNTLTIVWSEAVENGAGGGNGITLSASGGAVTATYSSGSGTDTYVYNLTGRVIQSGESITDDYAQPGDGIKSTATDSEVASFVDAPVTNASTVSGGMSPSLRAFAGLGAGF